MDMMAMIGIPSYLIILLDSLRTKAILAFLNNIEIKIDS